MSRRVPIAIRESQINEHAIHGIVDFFIEHILR